MQKEFLTKWIEKQCISKRRKGSLVWKILASLIFLCWQSEGGGFFQMIRAYGGSRYGWHITRNLKLSVSWKSIRRCSSLWHDIIEVLQAFWNRVHYKIGYGKYSLLKRWLKEKSMMPPCNLSSPYCLSLVEGKMDQDLLPGGLDCLLCPQWNFGPSLIDCWLYRIQCL